MRVADLSFSGGEVIRVFTKSVVEDAALAWLEPLGCQYVHGQNIAQDSEIPERLRTAVASINPTIPAEVREDAIKQIQRLNSPERISWRKRGD